MNLCLSLLLIKIRGQISFNYGEMNEFPDYNNAKKKLITKYFELYQNKGLPPYHLPGDTSKCGDIGISSAADRYEAINRISFYRYLAGINNFMVHYNDKYDQSQSEAAKIMYQENNLNNNLSPSFNCYTTEANKAAKESVILKGYNSIASSITKYILGNVDDYFRENCKDRRLLLYTQLKNVSFGIYKDFSNIRVSDTSNDPDDPNFKMIYVSYPPAGFFPRCMIPNYFTYSLTNNGIKDCSGDIGETTISYDNNSNINARWSHKSLYKDNYGDSTIIGYFDNSSLVAYFTHAEVIHMRPNIDNKIRVFMIFPFDYNFSFCLHTEDSESQCPEYSTKVKVGENSSQNLAEVLSDIINYWESNETLEIFLVGSNLQFSVYKSDLLSKNLFIKGLFNKDKSFFYQELTVIDDYPYELSDNVLILNGISLKLASKLKLSKLYLDEISLKSLNGFIEVDQLAYASSGKSNIMINDDSIVIDETIFYFNNNSIYENTISFNSIKIEALKTAIEAFSNATEEISIPSIHIQSTANTDRFIVKRSGSWDLIVNKDMLTATMFSNDIKNGGSSGIMEAPSPGTGDFIDVKDIIGITSPKVPKGANGVLIAVIVVVLVVIIVAIVVVVTCLRKKKSDDIKDGPLQI